MKFTFTFAIAVAIFVFFASPSRSTLDLVDDGLNPLVKLSQYGVIVVSNANRRRFIEGVLDGGDKEINPRDAITIQNDALAYQRFIDNISQKYGDFGSALSYSSGPLGVINFTVVGTFVIGGPGLGLIVPEVAAFLNSIATPTLSYTESGVAGGFPYSFTVSGIQNISVGLVALGLLAPKLYGQYQLNSAPDLRRIANNRYQASFYVDVEGQVSNAACRVNPACYPKSDQDPNLVYFTQKGFTKFQFVRSSDDDSVFKLDAIITQGRYTTRSTQLPPAGTTNFAVFNV